MFKRWFQKPPAVANGAFRHGNTHLIELRSIVKTFPSAAGTFTAPEELAALAALEAGPKTTQVQIVQAARGQAQANVQTQRDSLSAAKTNAELQLQQALADLTKAQSAYVRAQQNWQYVQDRQRPDRPNRYRHQWQGQKAE